METLADRAYRLAVNHVRPALPLPALVALLRGEGCPITAGALLAALRGDPERFRLLNPWRGTLKALAPVAAGSAMSARPDGSPEAGLAGVVVIADAPARSCGAHDRLRRAVLLLGRELDESSALERSRWLRLVAEAARLPAVA
jgi:hypothetical protein